MVEEKRQEFAKIINAARYLDKAENRDISRENSWKMRRTQMNSSTKIYCIGQMRAKKPMYQA